MRLVLGVRGRLSGEEIAGRAWEFLGLSMESGDGKASWLGDVYEQIRGEFRSPLRLASLAKIAGVHPVYLARCYRQRYRRSISQHIHELRLGHALSQMEKGMSIGEAAMEAGFSDQAHLSRLCKRFLSVTPRDLGLN
ncbi:MAG: helix-turn-helix transcriptional regulator [Chlorobia bacterium]|nr:helix-turn-helix transcriptional regulator [Fimbriimonadaceae bacterium]